MSRDFFVNGESLILVKGNSSTGIASLTQLGLAADPIRVSPVLRHRDINVDSWGEAPADVQWMLAEATVSMTLIHFDRDVLDICLQHSMGGYPTRTANGAPIFGRAGTRLGGGSPSTAGVNAYIRLSISSPIGLKPWLFYSAYLMNQPFEFPLGTEKSMVPLTWRIIPYPNPNAVGTNPTAGDPAGTVVGVNPTGAYGQVLWDYVNDS